MQIVIWWVSCLKPETKWHCKKRLATFHTMPLLSLHQWPSQNYILHNIFQPRIWHWRSARFPSTGRPYHVHLWKRSAEKELIRKYDPQTQCWCTHFFPWAKMTYVYRVIHVWDVHILNTPPSCIVHFLWTCYDSKAFAPDALPVAKICPKVFMCFSHVSLFTGFVHKSATFCFVPTAMIFSSFFATRSCIHRYLVCTCLSFPNPLLLAVPLAAEESLATTKSISNPQSR